MPATDEDDASRQLRLVRQAILSETSPCFEWDARAASNARDRCCGLQPFEIKRLVFEHVNDGGRLRQREESDEEWRNRRKFDFWYSVCFEVDGLDDPIFVKIALLCDDEEFPEARIVGAHMSSS